MNPDDQTYDFSTKHVKIPNPAREGEPDIDVRQMLEKRAEQDLLYSQLSDVQQQLIQSRLLHQSYSPDESAEISLLKKQN